MQIQTEVAELIMVNTASQINGMAFHIRQVYMREHDSHGVKHYRIRRNGIASARPREREVRVLGSCIHQYIHFPFLAAYDHRTRCMAVKVLQHFRSPVVDEVQRYGVRSHI